MKTFFFIFQAAALYLLIMVGQAAAQTVSFNYQINFEPAQITEPPFISGLPDVQLPADARKNGVEGKVKIALTFAETGVPIDVKVLEELPFGVTAAALEAVKNFKIKPAKLNGKPVPIKATVEFVVSAIYDEKDSNVKKAVIIGKPVAVYPESKRAEKVKGKVLVQATLFADGTSKIVGVSSVLPKEFDKAAIEAAKNIKFEPATHKKSKKPVAQVTTIEFDFKP